MIRENNMFLYEKEVITMSQFTKGMFFAGGIAVFGKCMYKLGRIKERKENEELWRVTTEEMNRVYEALKEVMKEGS